MHSYPMYTSWARKPLDPDFVPFTCAVTAALAIMVLLVMEIAGAIKLGFKGYMATVFPHYPGISGAGAEVAVPKALLITTE